MSNQDDKFGVALAQCFYCNKGNEIILNRRLSKPIADQVKEMDGKVISMTPCTECEEHMKQGVILITIDPHKSKADWHMPPEDEDERKRWMPNPFRSGGFFVVRDEAILRTFDEEMAEHAIKTRWMFIEHEAAVQVGLLDIETE